MTGEYDSGAVSGVFWSGKKIKLSKNISIHEKERKYYFGKHQSV
jgi:hypothetical protein